MTDATGRGNRGLDAWDPSSSTPPFPRDAVVAMVRRLPAYARLSLSLAREPRLSRVRRAAVLAAAGYVLSPIDLVPGFIPGIGQLDDMAVALTAIRFALGGLDAETRARHLSAVGLVETDVATDLRTVGTSTVWLVRAGGRLGVRSANAAVAAGGVIRHAAQRSIGTALRIGRRVVDTRRRDER